MRVSKLLVGWVGWLCASVWLAWLFVLSANSAPDLPDAFEIPHIDKILHWGYFGLGAVFLTLAVQASRANSHSWGVAFAVIVLLACVGAFDEWHQSFTPSRSANDIADWLTDLIGGTCGVLCTMGFLSFVLRFIDEKRHACLWCGIAIFLASALIGLALGHPNFWKA